MTRYCVLSIPRTGSTWMVNDVGRHYSTLKNYITLNEYFTPFMKDNVCYHLDENNMIYSTIEKDHIEISDVNEFRNKRLDILLKGDKNQPLIIKYMYWSHAVPENSDLENLQKIKDHNITIVNINRNPFESTISLLISKRTGVTHHWDTESESWYSTEAGRQTEISVTKVSIRPSDFEGLYTSFLIAYNDKLKLVDNLGCITVNYNTLESDCLNNNIPLEVNPHSKKLYDIPYSEIIQNYEELLEIKHKIDSIAHLLNNKKI